jgi:HAD superfamily hydrolase (TIGR01509 family)
MPGPTPDLDSLIAGWYAAFDAANAALGAAGQNLSASERRRHGERLNEERTETVRLLDGLARDRHTRKRLVRLVATPWEARRVLGVPSDATACVFNLDGVLIGSATLHAEAWRETFDDFFAERRNVDGSPLMPFGPHIDYPRYIHARPRLHGVRDLLASRGISLPEGRPDDPPGTATVHGLANRKNVALLRRLAERGVSAFEGARLYLELAHDAHIQIAVVSASANTEAMLARAHLTELIDERIDGTTMLAEHLRRTPAPDTLLAACRRLGCAPGRAVVFETSPDGIRAGRAGGFELVVGVDQFGSADALRAEGADLVVADLGELLETELAA